MKDQLKVSEQGLRLIKAFEGFRPVDRELVSGARVVGYGHKVRDGRSVVMSRAEAEAQLVDDLAPFEDMLNSRVYAPLNQAQFDALASLAFNIGPKAFLESDALRALNAGRPLDAAKGFDAWRLAKVGGETFVIDALVRRRTAEKALFLRPSPDALAPKAPSGELDVAAGDVAPDPQPVLDRDAAGRLVSDAPYDIERLITSMPSRRVEDGPAGELADSEVADPVLVETVPGQAADTPFAGLDRILDENPEAPRDPLDLGVYANDEPDTPEARVRTAIADAADEVRDRLEALMEPDARPAGGDGDMPVLPDALVDTTGLPSETRGSGAQVVAFPGARLETDPAETSLPERDSAEAPGSGDGPQTPATKPKRRFRLGSRRKAKAPGPAPEASDTEPTEETVIPVVETSPGRVEPDTRPEPDRSKADTELQAAFIPRTQVGIPMPAREEESAWVTTMPAVRSRDASWPYLLFLVLGGVLFGTGAALRLRGVERVFGLDGELASLGLLMVGALILLGGLLYLVKALLDVSRG